MSTVLRKGVFAVKIYGPPREHPPPHVHVEVGREGLVTIRLGLRDGEPPKVWEAYDVKDDDVLMAFRIVEQHQRELRRKWEEIHGSETRPRAGSPGSDSSSA